MTVKVLNISSERKLKAFITRKHLKRNFRREVLRKEMGIRRINFRDKTISIRNGKYLGNLIGYFPIQ